jgi:large subunit ribosomal protein L10
MVAKKKKSSKALELKKKKVSEIATLLEKHKTIGLINLANLPAKQLKIVRAKLRGIVDFVFARKTILKRALEETKKESAKQLIQYLDGIYPALVVSELGAFELFKQFKNYRQMVAAKPGQIAPKDIIVPPGPTPFAPGPAISELQQLGLKTKVEGGKIVIREEAIVVKQNSTISSLAASILSKLGITPIQVGINLVYVVENGDFYSANVLDVDVGKYTEDLKIAMLNVFKLAIELGFATKETIAPLVQKAYYEAKALETKLSTQK